MRGFFVSMVLVAVLFVAGCGGSGGGGNSTATQSSDLASKPATAVVAAASKAADSASSVHVSGSGTDSGKSISLDLTLAKGKGASGSISLNGASFDLILLGHTAYIKAGPAFWKKYGGPPAVAQLLENKWLKFSPNNKQLGPLTKIASPQSFFGLLKNHGKLANKGETTFKGQSVVAIDDTTQGGTLYVAATGTPYPAGLVPGGGSETGAIT